MLSGWVVDSQKSELPQRSQNERVPWSDEAWRTSRSPPSRILKRLNGTESQVTKPAPWMRRHIEQWQWAQ